MGTVAYMSPEQAEGKPVDTRTDTFSFGCVLYEMITGQRAFQRDSTIGTLSAILHEEPKPVSQLREHLPHEVERVIGRCLRKDPERRWQSMADVGAALQDLKDDLDSGSLIAHPRRSAVPAVHGPLWQGSASSSSRGAIAGFSWRGRTSPPDLPAPSFTAVPLTTYPGREQHGDIFT